MSDKLLRLALKALLLYAPSKCPTIAVPPEMGQGRVYRAACRECGLVLMGGKHEPDCRWMRARSVIGAIRTLPTSPSPFPPPGTVKP